MRGWEDGGVVLWWDSEGGMGLGWGVWRVEGYGGWDFVVIRWKRFFVKMVFDAS